MFPSLWCLMKHSSWYEYIKGRYYHFNDTIKLVLVDLVTGEYVYSYKYIKVCLGDLITYEECLI